MYELFNGFFSFDAKFWRTIIPLLINPGKVTKDYIEGKRSRYSNPFRFYLTISIFFFLILGVSNNIEKFKSFKNGEDKETLNISLFKEIEEITTPPDSSKTDSIPVLHKDSIPKINIRSVKFLGVNLEEFIQYTQKYPNSKIDDALDSLQLEKTILNRFFYSRAKAISAIGSEKGAQEQFINQLLSYGSVSLFVFLPLFTLFLRLFYFRKKHTYVDHLIFVFHTQTVFFMLLSLLYLISFFTNRIEPVIFLILFLIYLFLALKKCYDQGYFKTAIKFMILNLVYLFMSMVGIVIVGAISFALY